jgi:Arc/MetJ-type ribon-helix-helix transcriptional regulator
MVRNKSVEKTVETKKEIKKIDQQLLGLQAKWQRLDKKEDTILEDLEAVRDELTKLEESMVAKETRLDALRRSLMPPSPISLAEAGENVVSELLHEATNLTKEGEARIKKALGVWREALKREKGEE